jgi:hypothetical protein
VTREQLAALRTLLAPLTQFAFGPIAEDTPYTGQVALTAKQYRTLAELVES